MHSGKRDFPESPNQPDTRERITLGKIHLPRAQHSRKSRSRGRKVFHDVPTKQRRWGLKLKKFFPESQKKHSGKTLFPECWILTLGEDTGFPECCCPGTRGRGPSPSAKKGTRRTFFVFFVFLAQFFSDAFPHYFKLLVQIWRYLNFFKYISFVFYVSLIFFANFKFELQVH